MVTLVRNEGELGSKQLIVAIGHTAQDYCFFIYSVGYRTCILVATSFQKHKREKTLEKALDELFEAKKKFKPLKKRTAKLNHMVEQAGGFPDKNARIARNKAIYKKWKDGQKFSQIAKEYNLTSSAVSDICYSIDSALDINIQVIRPIRTCSRIKTEIVVPMLYQKKNRPFTVGFFVPRNGQLSNLFQDLATLNVLFDRSGKI